MPSIKVCMLRRAVCFVDYFAPCAGSSLAEKVIIFLTDGAPSDGSQVLPAQRIAAAKFQYTVTVLTYALGPCKSRSVLVVRLASKTKMSKSFVMPC